MINKVANYTDENTVTISVYHFTGPTDTAYCYDATVSNVPLNPIYPESWRISMMSSSYGWQDPNSINVYVEFVSYVRDVVNELNKRSPT